MKSLLIIYTMGKVASTTVSESLIRNGIICYDIHTIKKETILRNVKKFVDQGTMPSNHYGRSIEIYRRFQNARSIKVITLVRDTLSYNISKVFQNLPRGSYDLADIEKKVYKLPPDSTSKWLEYEFKTTTNIDVLNYPFNKNNNYEVFEQDRFKVLTMRFDLADGVKQQVLSDFVGKKITLSTRNDSNAKWYSDLYSNFKAAGYLKKNYVEACHNSDYMRHFYTPEEIAELSKKNELYYTRI